MTLYGYPCKTEKCIICRDSPGWLPAKGALLNARIS